MSQKVWRALPIMEMVRDIRRHLMEVDVDATEAVVSALLSEGQDERALALQQELLNMRQDLGGANALPGSVYAEVADVYRQAWRDGRPPTKAVAKHFQISDSAAAKRVMRARQGGLLPPTEKGVAGLGNVDGQS
jgi:hypothetical protein